MVEKTPSSEKDPVTFGHTEVEFQQQVIWIQCADPLRTVIVGDTRGVRSRNESAQDERARGIDPALRNDVPGKWCSHDSATDRGEAGHRVRLSGRDTP